MTTHSQRITAVTRYSKESADGQCGWLKDRFGVSWPVVPQQPNELLTGPDPEKVRRVTAALMQMKKIDVKALQQAAG